MVLNIETDANRKIIYDEIIAKWKTHLEPLGIKEVTANSQAALVLIYLVFHNRNVTKAELTQFVTKVTGRTCIDLQTARHLAAQEGYYIISGRRKDEGYDKYKLKSGEYRLITLERPYPLFNCIRRANSVKDWEGLKQEYENKCATCCNEENKPSRYTNRKVIIHKGHMDPRKELTMENCIPQCEECNQHYKGKYVFDKRGRVIKNL